MFGKRSLRGLELGRRSKIPGDGKADEDEAERRGHRPTNHHRRSLRLADGRAQARPQHRKAGEKRYGAQGDERAQWPLICLSPW